MHNVIEAKMLDKIPYFNKPPSQGGVLTYLEPKKLEEKLNFKYSESIHIAEHPLIKKAISSEVITQIAKYQNQLPRESSIIERLKQPFAKAAVCFMNEEIGCILIALDDIPQGTVLFMYAGVITHNDLLSSSDRYAYQYGTAEEKKSITGQAYGGLSRFMPHLPNDKEKYKQKLKTNLLNQLGLKFMEEKNVDLDSFVNMYASGAIDNEIESIEFKDSNTRAQLATSNVDLKQVIINDSVAIICFSEYYIKKYDVIGFSYGKNYWDDLNSKPKYMTSDAKRIISPNEYKELNNIDATLSNKTLFFDSSSNPMNLYHEGVKFFREGNFKMALEKLSLSLTLFIKIKKDDKNIECANCYSSLASCFRELKKYKEAILECEKAIEIFYLCKKDSKKISEKYNLGLKLLSLSDKELYDSALMLYESKCYLTAALKIEFILSKNVNLDLADKIVQWQISIYYSTLGACYHKLGNEDKVIECLKKTLDIRKNFSDEQEPSIEKLKWN